MKKILILILTLFISSVATAKDVSEFFSNLIPGEGITEASIEINDGDEDQLNFSILGLRNIEKTNSSNFFTQFSLMNTEVNNKNRFITNIGLGNRILTQDKSMMLGANIFYDRDFFENHNRASLGLEGKAHMLDLNLNFYEALSNTVTVDDNDEKVLSGYEIGIASQIPYMPWTKFHYTDYLWDADKAIVDTKGKILSLEMFLSPSITIEGSFDKSGNTGVDDESSMKVAYVYPPRENRTTLADGLTVINAFEKRDMSKELTEKVRRNNKIVLETQGSIIVTKK
jgi:hypothetical protein